MYSPLIDENIGQVPVIKGVKLSVIKTGESYKNRNDLLLMEFEDGANVAGVFTKSSIVAHNVRWCKYALSSNKKAKALLVNTGNANCCNGPQGEKANDEIVKNLAKIMKVEKEEIYTCSTGIIGREINEKAIIDKLPEIHKGLKDDLWVDAAKTIMTTDTFYKVATKFSHIGGVPVTINGIAKGSGMIAPNMATTLAFVVTDADIPPKILQELLKKAIKTSFNVISVDGDTSTNDTVLLFSTGKSAKHTKIRSDKEGSIKDFSRALNELLIQLAKLVILDGEGATKIIEVNVTGAKNFASAKNIAMSIANSPLIKSAIAGSDPNWGRIMMAIGKSGEDITEDKVELKICGHPIFVKGKKLDFDDVSLRAEMTEQKEVKIEVNVGNGKKSATVWGCDLTSRYVDINIGYAGHQT